MVFVGHPMTSLNVDMPSMLACCVIIQEKALTEFKPVHCINCSSLPGLCAFHAISDRKVSGQTAKRIVEILSPPYSSIFLHCGP